MPDCHWVLPYHSRLTPYQSPRPLRFHQNPKSPGVNPDCRMIERVVPIGSSFFGWGTMTMRPAAFRHLV